MNQIKAKYENKILTIYRESSRKTNHDQEKYKIDLLEIGKQYKTGFKVTKREDKNKILFLEPIDSIINEDSVDEELVENKMRKQPVIVVYAQNEKVKFMYCTMEEAYKKLLKIRYKILGLSLNKSRVKVRVLAYIVNRYGIEFGETKFYIDKDLGKKCQLKQYPNSISKLKMIKDWNIYTFSFKMEDILKDSSTINGPIRFSININGNEINYKVEKRNKRIKNTKYYYIPMKRVYVKEYAVHIRRGATGALVLVKRKKEPVENTLKFRFLESTLASKIMYLEGKIANKFRKRKINLFFEKYSSKAEEGAYDLFLLFQKHKNTRNYFIIDENSDDYEKIKNTKGVLKKFSLKYYWAIYNALNCIANEVPLHLNILRSNNKILRKCLAEKKLIFLQHGVTYLKCHGKNSSYITGREGTLDYIVAGSEKEKDVIVEMLNMEEEQVLKTGLPIFSKVKYKHINEDSKDLITIMLTWKPYEEHLLNFEESFTYKSTLEVCKMLEKYLPKENINIVAHPKAFELIEKTDLKSSLWKKPISEALGISKLLITDYSSVCYNSFYQGGGVIFYQPDLEKYELENGNLIPRNDEYIGKRAFNIFELEEIIKNTVKNKKIDLNYVRTRDFEENYKTINEFSDGKNIDRIYENLLREQII